FEGLIREIGTGPEQGTDGLPKPNVEEWLSGPVIEAEQSPPPGAPLTPPPEAFPPGAETPALSFAPPSAEALVPFVWQQIPPVDQTDLPTGPVPQTPPAL